MASKSEEKSKEELRQDVRDSKQEAIPSNLVDLYMLIQSRLSLSVSSHDMYRVLLQSINIGKALLPDTHKSLMEQTELALENENIYPKNRSMEYAGGLYKLVGGGTTGTIQIRPDELDKGILESRDQQCDKLIPVLKKLDNKIMKALKESNIIPTKDPMKQFMDNIMNEMQGLMKDVKKRG